MVPVCVPGAKHVRKAYRPALGGVKSAAVEAFESVLRLSLTPYGVPSGAIQMDSASPCRTPGRIVWPMLVSSVNTDSGGAPSRSIEASSGSH
jgi:hypothetical protein